MILLRRSLLPAVLALFAPIWLGSIEVAKAAQVGVLHCNVSPAVGFIVTTSKNLACRFSRHYGYPPEFYVGNISIFGLALGATGPGYLVWAVFAATPTLNPWALAGSYGGAAANVTVGLGAGANALIGGNGNSIALQPLSINTQTGLAVSAGISSLILDPAPR